MPQKTSQHELISNTRLRKVLSALTISAGILSTGTSIMEFHDNLITRIHELKNINGDILKELKTEISDNDEEIRIYGKNILISICIPCNDGTIVVFDYPGIKKC